MNLKKVWIQLQQAAGLAQLSWYRRVNSECPLIVRSRRGQGWLGNRKSVPLDRLCGKCL